MAADPTTSRPLQFWPPRPWHVLLAGLGITALGLATQTIGEAVGGLRFVLFLVGLITAGVGVSMRLKTAGQAFEERMETAGILAVAAFAALLAFLGTDATWDSLQMVLVVLIAVALLGVVLVLLPKTVRMIVVGLLILLHFGGMMTAATTIDPPGSVAPWVSQELWTRFYRPYLQFMYLNNAYHFYSPEPGPPSLVWFHIKYQDGRVKWYKIPHRDDDPVGLHHTRLLSITESTSVYQPATADLNRFIKAQGDRRIAEIYGVPLAPDYIMAVSQQYQPAQEYSEKMLASYVRHIAGMFPTLGGADNAIKSIKVYRFRQNIMLPQYMAEGRNPLDKTLFSGYYQGEYKADGTLLRGVYDEKGNLLKVNDPFRFWYMPIYYMPKDHTKLFVEPTMKLDDLELHDYLTIHAQLDLDKQPNEQPNDPNDSPWDDAQQAPRPGVEKPQ